MSDSSLLDRHLDALLPMALEQLEREEVAALAQSGDPEVNADEALRADDVFQGAYQTVRRDQRQARRATAARKTLRGLRFAGIVFAAMVILALIAFPLALATSAEFRTTVMEYLVHVDEAAGHFSIVYRPADTPHDMQTAESANAPGVWLGSCYMAYIPQGFALTEYDTALPRVVYTSESGQKISFAENTGSMPEPDIPEDGFFMLEAIQGGDFPVVEEQADGVDRITVTWETAGKWFRLITENVGREETLRIADSVQGSAVTYPVDSSRPRYQLLTVDGVPAWWAGNYFPTAVPEDMGIVSFYSGNVTYRGKGVRQIRFTEAQTAYAAYASSRSPISVSQVEINGVQATMIVSNQTDPSNQVVDISWMVEDTLLMLKSTGVEPAEALAMARGIARVDWPEDAKRPEGIPIQRDERGNALPPEEWQGDFFPAFVPEGVVVSAVNNESKTYTLLDPATGLRASVQEGNGNTRARSVNQATDARLVQVGGVQGLLICYERPDFTEITLNWNIGVINAIEMSATMPEETVLRIAASIRKTSPAVGLDAFLMDNARNDPPPEIEDAPPPEEAEAPAPAEGAALTKSENGI